MNTYNSTGIAVVKLDSLLAEQEHLQGLYSIREYRKRCCCDREPGFGFVNHLLISSDPGIQEFLVYRDSLSTAQVSLQ
jgi:hypothetical protein